MDRRIFLLLLAGVALAALATACGGGSQAAARTPAATASAETATKPAASATTSVQSAPTSVPEPSATAVEQAPTDTPVVAATPAPTQAPPPPTPPTPPPTGGAASVRIAAINTLFSPASLSAPVGATVTLTLDSQDEGVTHDIMIFDASGGQIGATDLGTGPIVQTVTFAVGGPGNYSFKCSVHPQQMRGLLKVE